jgi:hypothetical protein
MINRRALTIATLVGTVLQVAMVVSGHTVASVKDLFAVGGMTISLVAGIAYGLLSPRAESVSPTLGGLLAGGVCALIGIGVSFGLGDVPASLLALGTLSSAVTGAIGGWVTAKLVRTRDARPAAEIR